jgi:beta-lactamase regulating signal transducer with metallopeptidase domain
MTALSAQPYAQALAWALLHFLWQGALLGLVAFVLFHVFSTPAARYRVGIATLTAMLLALAATTVWIAVRAEPTAGVAAGTSVVPDQRAPMPPSSLRAVETAPGRASGSTLPSTVLLVWLTGVIALSVRLLGGWLHARRVAHHDLRPAAPEILAMTRRLAERLVVSPMVDVAESAAVNVPIMIGWLKPVVILPTAVVSGFTPEQVEALLAHELAHVRRSDYLVNLLQAIVETALFYHPAVWWVSRRVRTAREHCCDDLTVTICDRLVYARALSNLAEMATPQLAMAATGDSLVDRVRRILGRPSESAEAGAGWLPVFLIMMLAAPALSTPSASSSRATQPQVVPQVATVTPQSDVASQVATAAAPAPAQSQEAPAKATTAQAKQSAEAAGAQDRPQQVLAIEAQIKQLLEAQRALDARRTDLAIAQHASETNAKVEDLQLVIQQLRAKTELLKRQVDTGLASPNELNDLLSQIQQTQLEMSKVQKEREYFEMSARLNQAAADQKREYDQVIREYETAYGKQFATGRPILDVGTEGAELGAGESIRAGDVMTIVIPGEPTLPPTYRVTPEGTIKLPLMPPLHVTGMTPAQAGEAINNQLKDRKVSNDPRVAITVRRPQ